MRVEDSADCPGSPWDRGQRSRMAAEDASFISNDGGTVDTAFRALLFRLIAGRAHGSIHSTQFTGGEIGANLVQTPLSAAA